jgi:uncharacterized protein (TIGR03067 family)
MKWLPIALVVIALLSTTACSGRRATDAAPRAQPRPDAATPAAPRDLAKEDLAKLQGAWRIESSIWNGVREPETAKSVMIVFQGDKFITVDKDGNRLEDAIKLFPHQNPKAIDYWSKGGGQAAPGIYALEGDTFKWCSAGGNNQIRPTSFVSEHGSKQSLVVMRRKKS